MSWNWPWLSEWVDSVALAAAALMGGWIGAIVLLKIGKRVSILSQTRLDDLVVQICSNPLKALGPVLGLSLVFPLIRLPQSLRDFASQVLALLTISCLAWLGFRMTDAVESWILYKYDISVRDNLKARAVQTQVRIIKRVVAVVLMVLALASGLMTFEKVRQLGTGILASAGIAGIILGVAAQRTISTLLAGLQIAMTQPFRIDDVLVVEGEWGRVEEITLTYVVLRIWDLRRLVVPISHFVEKPFQNWTRVSADLLGTVLIYVDYTVDVASLREELLRIAKGTDLWDGKVCSLQVTNATERTVELRALVSASDSSRVWDLRCHVRERLLAYLQSKHPSALPKARAVLETSGGTTKNVKTQAPGEQQL
ncbi:MAG: mechanosensitive ion channel domain-containing protein [bacterium]